MTKGERIKARREELGITQVALADMSKDCPRLWKTSIDKLPVYYTSPFLVLSCRIELKIVLWLQRVFCKDFQLLFCISQKYSFPLLYRLSIFYW